MKVMICASAAAILATAAPAEAQTRRPAQPQPGASTQLAQQVSASGDQPDVLLDIPNLSVGELTVEVSKLNANISLDARLGGLLKLTAGADVSVDQVKIQLKDVQATATLVVRLDNVRAIIERTLQTVDSNPQIVSGLLSTVDNTVGTVGGVANNAVGTVGGIATNLLRSGQVLDLARAGLTEVSRTVNAQGQTLVRARNGAGQLLDIVTDSANRVVSSRAAGR
ncbi:hypothetical protein [Sphingomonas swuensis]|uniref:hypothetical protein n=1 Tax=Sphingomonas swuensis TaxID=977800 RepID=UPI0031D00F11